MKDVLLHDSIASLLAHEVCDPAFTRDKNRFVVFGNVSEEAKAQLHRYLKPLGRAALALDPSLDQEAGHYVYLGRILSAWKPVITQIHQLEEATSARIATELGLSERDVAARLSHLASSQIVYRKWNKDAPGRGAFVYRPIPLPVLTVPQFAVSSETMITA